MQIMSMNLNCIGKSLSRNVCKSPVYFGDGNQLTSQTEEPMKLGYCGKRELAKNILDDAKRSSVEECGNKILDEIDKLDSNNPHCKSYEEKLLQLQALYSEMYKQELDSKPYKIKSLIKNGKKYSNPDLSITEKVKDSCRKMKSVIKGGKKDNGEELAALEKYIYKRLDDKGFKTDKIECESYENNHGEFVTTGRVQNLLGWVSIEIIDGHEMIYESRVDEGRLFGDNDSCY